MIKVLSDLPWPSTLTHKKIAVKCNQVSEQELVYLEEQNTQLLRAPFDQLLDY